ncbi:tubulin polyglutamylase [Pycnococcus provasolii]
MAFTSSHSSDVSSENHRIRRISYKSLVPAGPSSAPRICLEQCKYPIMHVVAAALCMVETAEVPDTLWDLFWSDLSVSPNRVMRLKPYQRINHFPGMMEICRKASLARHVRRMKEALPRYFDFTPETLIVTSARSTELEQVVGVMRKRAAVADANGEPAPVFIVKPDAGAMGRGIFLASSERDLDGRLCRGCVVQEYIPRPLLINQRKFDLRLYVLVTRVDPLRVYLFCEGLARFATEPYNSPSRGNLGNQTMHLTNYSVNKHSQGYQKGSQGNKRLLSSVMDTLRAQQADTGELWRRIQKLVVKTVLPIQPTLAHNYVSVAKRPHSARSAAAAAPAASKEWNHQGNVQPEQEASRCMEMLGLDVLVDESLKPWLIEVNHSPSFGCDEDVDVRVKMATLTAAVKSLQINGKARCNYERDERKAQDLRLYRTTDAFGRVRSGRRRGGAAARMVPSEDEENANRQRYGGGASSLASSDSADMVHGGFARVFPPLPDRLETVAWAQAAASASADGSAGLAAWNAHEDGDDDVAAAYSSELHSCTHGGDHQSLPAWMACSKPHGCDSLTAEYREILQSAMLLFDVPGCTCSFCRARTFWLSMKETRAMLPRFADGPKDNVPSSSSDASSPPSSKPPTPAGPPSRPSTEHRKYSSSSSVSRPPRASSAGSANSPGRLTLYPEYNASQIGSRPSPLRTLRTGTAGGTTTPSLLHGGVRPSSRPSSSRTRGIDTMSEADEQTMKTISRVVGGNSLGAYRRVMMKLAPRNPAF